MDFVTFISFVQDATALHQWALFEPDPESSCLTPATQLAPPS